MDEQLRRYIITYTTEIDGEENDDQVMGFDAPDIVHAINQLLDAYRCSSERVTIIQSYIVD